MIYLSSFKLCDEILTNPNIYPHNVFRNKDMPTLFFSPVTVLYGNNGSGKSTILNIIANKLGIKGRESIKSIYGTNFIDKCRFSLGEDEETGRLFNNVPEGSRQLKSEDILYEIKKVQQQNVLEDGILYDYIQGGMTKEEAENYLATEEGSKQIGYILFAQEKYSNGEMAMLLFRDWLKSDALYLLDEPEVSLSPANQVKLAEEILSMTRYLNCQFIIATHSPFMLGTLNAKIYNIDTPDFRESSWSELDNVRYFYDFFKKHRDEFETKE